MLAIILSLMISTAQPAEQPQTEYIGTYEITAYSSHETPGTTTASGTTVRPYKTVAVDPNVIPLGTELYIEDLDLYVVAEDTGGAVQGNIIDLYIGSDNAINFGKQTHEVYLVR